MDDAMLLRYVALARRVHALTREPVPESVDAPGEVRLLLAAGAYRLGLYASAMPGVHPPLAQELRQLAERLAALEGPDGPDD